MSTFRKNVPTKEVWIPTHSGRKLYLFNPQPDQFVLDDILRGIACEPRYRGQAKYLGYSVGQHTLLLMSLVPKELEKQALFHDAPEFALGDMVRALKRCYAYSGEYIALEAQLWGCIAAKYNLPVCLDVRVHLADDKLGTTELRDLMPPLSGYLGETEAYPYIPFIEMDTTRVYYLLCQEAKRLELDLYK